MDISEDHNTEFRHICRRLSELLSGSDAKIAIYGTGSGAKIVYSALKAIGCVERFLGYIERDDWVEEKIHSGFKDKLYRLAQIIDVASIIIVAGKVNHKLIATRLKKDLIKAHANSKVIDIYGEDWNSTSDKVKYVTYLETYRYDYSNTFVDFKDYSKSLKSPVKLIAWYLPQYYRMDVNDKFHGRGYTEWISSSQGRPIYTGHYQPHIPYDVGYYNLLDADAIKRQAFLAQNYGIYGFCMHYYWFNGKRVMTKPAELLLEHKEIAMPFCFNWANENWTTVWSDTSPDIIYEQSYPIDVEKFMSDLIPFLMDKRYIRINGCPVLSVYRCDLMGKDNCIKMTRKLRNSAVKNGLDGLYLIATTASDIDEKATEWGFDSMVEFPPWNLWPDNYKSKSIRPDCYISPNYVGYFCDMTDFINNKFYLKKHNNKCFRSVMLSYDNTARRMEHGAAIYYGLNPNTYSNWLTDVMQESITEFADSERLVFLNSWNEWGEGQHLEPDMKYGYAYLDVTRKAIDKFV